MKYKIGDKVRIRRDLVAGKRYGDNTYIDTMEWDAKSHDYVLTINKYTWNNTQYSMVESGFNWTEEMIEGLAELTDRQKFEGWMRKLSSLPYDNKVWHAFNYIVITEPDKDGYDDKLKIVSDFLFAEKKKMTKGEIEKELGYKIEIVEGE